MNGGTRVLDEAQLRLYAEWRSWARSVLFRSAAGATTAALAALDAMQSGANAAEAAEQARRSPLRRLTQPRPRKDDDQYADWYHWARTELSLHSQDAHTAAAAGLRLQRAGMQRSVQRAGSRRAVLIQRLLRAATLSRELAAGRLPQRPTLPHFHLQPGERVYATTEAIRVEFYGLNPDIRTVSYINTGNVLLTAAVLGTTASHNNAQIQAARAQWRQVDQGPLHFTNGRMAFQGRRGWIDIWYPDISASNCTADGIEIALSGARPLRFDVSSPEWYFTLFRFMARGEVVEVPITDDLIVEAVALGIKREHPEPGK